MPTGFDVSKLQRRAAIPVRLVAGYGFIAHGYAMVVNGPGHLAASLQELGVPAPHLMAWAPVGFELLGGPAVLGGAYIPLISVPLTVILLTPVFTVDLPYGFTSIKLRAVTAAGPQFGPPRYETDCCKSLRWRRWSPAEPAPLASARGFRVSAGSNR